MSEGFTKLFSSITASSIWCEDHATRIVWVTMLAMADRDGYVGASVPGLAAIARVTIDEARRAIDKFMSPDPDSRSDEYDGRRIEKASRGWLLLNYERFRKERDDEDRRSYERERKRAQRSTSQHVRDMSGTVPDSPGQSRVSRDVPECLPNAEAEAEANADAEVGTVHTSRAHTHTPAHVCVQTDLPIDADESGLGTLENRPRVDHNRSGDRPSTRAADDRHELPESTVLRGLDDLVTEIIGLISGARKRLNPMARDLDARNPQYRKSIRGFISSFKQIERLGLTGTLREWTVVVDAQLRNVMRNPALHRFMSVQTLTRANGETYHRRLEEASAGFSTESQTVAVKPQAWHTPPRDSYDPSGDFDSEDRKDRRTSCQT